MRKVLGVFLIVLGSMGLVFPGFGYAGEQTFRISMDKILAMKNAYLAVMETVAGDGRLLQQWKAESEKAHGREDQNELTVICERLAGTDKRIAAAFANAGTSPKEAGMTMETVIGSFLGLTIADGAGVKKLAIEDPVLKREYRTDPNPQRRNCESLIGDQSPGNKVPLFQ